MHYRLLMRIACGMMPGIFMASPSAHGETPTQVTACQLSADPAHYDHALVEVTGHITHAFEVFTIASDHCQAPQQNMGIWLEYGGRKNSGTVYCCGVPANGIRPANLVVEGVECDLDDDAIFQQFDQIMDNRNWTEANATVMGRFFAGRKSWTPNGQQLGGYGHLGAYSLLVIQKVLSVTPVEPKLPAPPPPPGR